VSPGAPSDRAAWRAPPHAAPTPTINAASVTTRRTADDVSRHALLPAIYAPNGRAEEKLTGADLEQRRRGALSPECRYLRTQCSVDLPGRLPSGDALKSFSTVNVLKSGEKVPVDVPKGLPSIFTTVTE